MGAAVHPGSLDDVESLKSGAAAADGVIHLAFIHDFSKFAENGQIDKRAIEAMGSVLEGSGKPFVVTSGVGLLTPGRLATEDDEARSGDAIPRVSEATGLAFASRGVRATAVRLPQVHGGEGKAGFVGYLYEVARDKRKSAYIGDGSNRWSAAHRLDVARLYRLALEKGTAGAAYHAVADEAVPLRDIAAVFAKRPGYPRRLADAGRGRRPFRLDRDVRRSRHAGLEREDPGRAGLESERDRPPRRYRSTGIFQGGG